jgi:hypothetical protein
MPGGRVDHRETVSRDLDRGGTPLDGSGRAAFGRFREPVPVPSSRVPAILALFFKKTGIPRCAGALRATYSYTDVAARVRLSKRKSDLCEIIRGRR